MKIKDWIVIAAGLLFAWLFYRQGLGVNFAAYSLFMGIVLAALYPAAAKKPNWWWAAGALVFSAGCLVVYGNALCFIATLFSMFLLAGITARTSSPAFANFVQSGLSLVLAVPGIVRGWQLTHRRVQSKKKTAIYWPVYVIVVAIFLLFVLLYSRASNAFSALLSWIDLSFISFGWIFTALFGMVLATALLRHKRLRLLDKLDARWGRPLTALLDTFTRTERQQQLSTEIRTGRLLFILLNMLLLVVNVADIAFLAGGMEGMYHDYADMVHQGIGSLILSIVVAVGIILYFFRGELNFEKEAKPLYFLALLWVAQNMVLAGTAAIKNTLYIDITAAITYKRVGVYYYLLLCSIGLLFTAYKLYAQKPNWYLVRVNFIAFFTVLVVSCAIHWDALITEYNIQKAKQENKTPDIYYLMGLDDNLPQLIQWALDNKSNPRVMADHSVGEYDAVCTKLEQRGWNFINRYEQQDWRSFNYADYTTYSYLKSINLDAVEEPVAVPQIPQPEIYLNPND